MARRVLDVTAYTTLDLVDGAVRGRDWREESDAVVDVRTPSDDPEVVALDVEFDHDALERVGVHADTVSLTAEQARALAAALESAADDDGTERRGRG